MWKLTSILAAALIVGVALADEPNSAVGDDTKAAEQGADQAESKPVVAAADANKDSVQLPPGFKKKKRGEHVLYCIKGKATGSRFPTENCYDEAGLKDYILKRDSTNRAFEQNRAVCSNPATCASQ